MTIPLSIFAFTEGYIASPFLSSFACIFAAQRRVAIEMKSPWLAKCIPTQMLDRLEMKEVRCST